MCERKNAGSEGHEADQCQSHRCVPQMKETGSEAMWLSMQLSWLVRQTLRMIRICQLLFRGAYLEMERSGLWLRCCSISADLHARWSYPADERARSVARHSFSGSCTDQTVCLLSPTPRPVHESGVSHDCAACQGLSRLAQTKNRRFAPAVFFIQEKRAETAAQCSGAKTGTGLAVPAISAPTVSRTGRAPSTIA